AAVYEPLVDLRSDRPPGLVQRLEEIPLPVHLFPAIHASCQAFGWVVLGCHGGPWSVHDDRSDQDPERRWKNVFPTIHEPMPFVVGAPDFIVLEEDAQGFEHLLGILDESREVPFIAPDGR